MSKADSVSQEADRSQTTSDRLNSTNDASVQFLLEEYKHLHELYLRQRVKRSQRVDFFVGLLTAVVGGLVLAAQSGSIDQLTLVYVSIGILALLAAFGFQIHNSLVLNDINSEGYLRRLDLIEQYFVERDEELRSYLPFAARKQPSSLLSLRPSSIRITVQLMVAALLSSMVIIAQLLFSPAIPFWRGAATLTLTSGTTIIGFNRWAQAMYQRACEKYNGEFSV